MGMVLGVIPIVVDKSVNSLFTYYVTHPWALWIFTILFSVGLYLLTRYFKGSKILQTIEEIQLELGEHRRRLVEVEERLEEVRGELQLLRRQINPPQ